MPCCKLNLWICGDLSEGSPICWCACDCVMAFLSHRLLGWQVNVMKPVSGRFMAFVTRTEELSVRPEILNSAPCMSIR